MIETLYTVHREPLLRYCRGLTGDGSAAEDLVQETFLRAMGEIDRLEELSEAKRGAWLRKTAKNLFIDGWRRRKRLAEDPEEPAAWDDHSAVEVEELCGALPAEERMLFVLRYLEGYNSRELGELFCLPPSTVRARLASARRKFRQYYKET